MRILVEATPWQVLQEPRQTPRTRQGAIDAPAVDGSQLGASGLAQGQGRRFYVAAIVDHFALTLPVPRTLPRTPLFAGGVALEANENQRLLAVTMLLTKLVG